MGVYGQTYGFYWRRYLVEDNTRFIARFHLADLHVVKEQGGGKEDAGVSRTRLRQCLLVGPRSAKDRG